MSNGGLILKLQRVINRTAEDSDVDSNIARYLLQHMYKKEFSINEIAKEGYISKASISRFAQNLGYSGFNDLKQDYHEAIIEKEEMKVDVQATKKLALSEEKAFMSHELEKIIDDLEKYKLDIDMMTIDRICELIHHYAVVHFYATQIPGNMAEILQHQLLTAGKFIEYYPVLPEQIHATEKLTKNSLAVFISLEGSYIMQKNLTLRITSSEAYTILITQNPTMKLSSQFDEIVALGNHGNEQSGKYKLLFFIEALVHRYYIKFA